MTLRPSAFYGTASLRLHTLRRARLHLSILTMAALTVAILPTGAAALRTSAVRASIWRNVSAARRSDPGPCMSGSRMLKGGWLSPAAG